MKRIICLLFTGLLVAFSGCSSSSVPKSSYPESTDAAASSALSEAVEKTITFTDENFGQQMESISLLPNAYIGRPIQYSGYFCTQEITTGRETAAIPFVLRDIPADAHGCTTAGFEIYYEGEYPENDQWVEITGVLEYVVHGGLQLLRVQVSSWETTAPPAETTMEAVSELASAG